MRGVSGINVSLADGSEIVVVEETITDVIEALWVLSGEMRGAVSCVGKLDHLRRQPRFARRKVELTVGEKRGASIGPWRYLQRINSRRSGPFRPVLGSGVVRAGPTGRR